LRAVTRLTNGLRCEAQWFHNETGASEIADFLVAVAPPFVRIFLRHMFERIVR